MQASNSSKIDAFTMANNLSFIPSLNAQHFNQYHSLEDVFPNLKASWVAKSAGTYSFCLSKKRKAKGRFEGTCLFFMTPEVGSWLHPLAKSTSFKSTNFRCSNTRGSSWIDAIAVLAKYLYQYSFDKGSYQIQVNNLILAGVFHIMRNTYMSLDIIVCCLRIGICSLTS